MRCREKESFKCDIITEDNLEYILKEYYNMDIVGCNIVERYGVDKFGEEFLIKFSAKKYEKYTSTIIIYENSIIEHYNYEDKDCEDYIEYYFEFNKVIVKDCSKNEGMGYPLYSIEEFEEKYEIVEE